MYSKFKRCMLYHDPTKICMWAAWVPITALFFLHGDLFYAKLVVRYIKNTKAIRLIRLSKRACTKTMNEFTLFLLTDTYTSTTYCHSTAVSFLDKDRIGKIMASAAAAAAAPSGYQHPTACGREREASAGACSILLEST